MATARNGGDGGGQVTFPKLFGTTTTMRTAGKGGGEAMETWKICCMDILGDLSRCFSTISLRIFQSSYVSTILMFLKTSMGGGGVAGWICW